jgi:hypothetical protein
VSLGLYLITWCGWIGSSLIGTGSFMGLLLIQEYHEFGCNWLSNKLVWATSVEWLKNLIDWTKK